MVFHSVRGLQCKAGGGGGEGFRLRSGLRCLVHIAGDCRMNRQLLVSAEAGLEHPVGQMK